MNLSAVCVFPTAGWNMNEKKIEHGEKCEKKVCLDF